MTEPRYFVRTQGRVSGPFTVNQIRALHQRGHFGRFHEVSADQRTWQPAGEFPELFPVPTVTAPPLPAPTPLSAHDLALLTGQPGTAPPMSAPTPAPPPTPVVPPPEPPAVIPAPASQAPVVTPSHWQEVDWYFQDPSGEPQGPVSLAHLERLRGEGAVTDNTLVCKPGMDSWTELRTALGERMPSASAAPIDAPATRLGSHGVRFGLLLALGSGGASLLELLPLLVGFLVGWSSKLGAPLLGFYAVLLFAALGADATAYVCCALGPLASLADAWRRRPFWSPWANFSCG